MGFNKEQQAAIDSRGQTILVSAPAGSGKTRILVARMDDLIKKDLYDMDSFLVLTFTDAAGSEMKQRLNIQLHEDLLDPTLSDDVKKHIQKCIDKLPNSYMTTFDSFCKTLLEKYGYLVGVMPGFEILSSSEAMEKEVLDECFNKWIHDDKFKDFFKRHYISNHFDELKSMLITYNATLGSFVDFKKTLEEYHNKYYIFDDFNDSSLFDLVKDIYISKTKECFSHFNTLYNYAQNHNIDDFFEGDEEKEKVSQSEALYQTIDDIYKMLNAPITYDQFIKISFPKIKTTTIKWKDLGISDDIKKEFSSLKTKVLKPLKDIMSTLNISDIDTFKDILNLTYNDLYYLFGNDGLLSLFQEAFLKRKQENNLLDFHDLEDYATKLLDPSLPVLSKLNNTFKEIMVDEYQDTNQIQENLVTMIAGCHKDYSGFTTIPMFMVGDMKQSIYRFRQADPQIFKYKFDHFTPLDMNPKAKELRIDLKYNYRSQKCVLDSINYIFDSIMDKEVGGLEYINDENAVLRYDFNAKNDRSLQDLEKIHDYDSEVLIAMSHKNKDYSKVEIEAHMVAQKIINHRNNNHNKYSDFAILMRNATDFITYKKIFESYNIPSNITLSKGLLSSNECKSIIALLKAIINPYDDIALVSVLRNHFLFSHFNENELLKIRIYNEKMNPLYEDLKLNTDNKVIHFLEVFENLRLFSYTNTPYEILKKVYKETGFDIFVSQLINGNQRSVNLDTLLEMARISKHSTLTDFVNELLLGSEKAPGKIASDNSDAVEFMTIHKSKGLQFKIVFLSGTYHQFNKMDETSFILLDKDKGIASKLRLYKENNTFGNILSEFENPYRDMIKHYIHKEAINEEMRILYVALTRAENKLIITSVLDDQSKLISLAREVQANDSDPSLTDPVVFNNSLRNKNNYFDWIISSLMRHPEIKQSLINYYPEIKPYLKLQESKFKRLNNDETYLARFHLTITNINELSSNMKQLSFNNNYLTYDTYKKYYDYTYTSSDKKRSIAVTTLQKLEDEKKMIFDESSLSNNALSLTLGTLVHQFIYHLSFNNDNVDTLFNTLKNNGFFNEESIKLLQDYMPHINKFVSSPLYKQISLSKSIYKEKIFRYKKDNQIINGIMDLVFIDDNNVYVVDYKTDHITSNISKNRLISKHQLQLSLYKEVLEKTFHKNVIGYVYYLETNECVEV